MSNPIDIKIKVDLPKSGVGSLAEVVSQVNKTIEELQKKAKIEIKFDSTQFSQINSQIKNIQTQLNNSLNVSNNSGVQKLQEYYKGATKSAEDLYKTIEKTKNATGEYEILTTNIKKLSDGSKEVSKSLQTVVDNTEKLKEAQKEMDRLHAQALKENKSYDDTANAFAKAEQKKREELRKTAEEQAKIYNKLQEVKWNKTLDEAYAENDRYNKSLQERVKLEQQVNQEQSKYWSQRTKETVNSMTQTPDELVQMRNYYKSLEKDIGTVEQAQRKLNQSQEEYWKNRRKESVESITKPNDDLVKMRDYYKEQEKLSQQIELFRKQTDTKITKITGKYDGLYDEKALNSVINSMNKLDAETADARQEMKLLAKELDNIEMKARTNPAGIKGDQDNRSLFKELKNGFSKFGEWMFIGTITMQSVRAVQGAIEYINQMDNALNEVRIVTGKTQSEVNNLAQSYVNLGKAMSVSSKDIASTSVELYRQGLNDDEVNERMKAIIEYSKISSISLQDSEKIITATANATGENVQKIIDIFALLGDQTASGADEIGEALQRVASAAENSGISLEKSASWIATISSITREGASTIGRSLNSLISRYESIKEKGFNEEDATQINDVTKALSSLGIAAVDSTGQLRPITEVMDELGGKWDDLTKNEKAYIATTLGGTYQRNRLITLLDNYNMSLKNYETALNSAGTAHQKFEIYQDSTQAKVDKLKATVEELASSALSSSVTKFFIDFATVLMKCASVIGFWNTALFTGIPLLLTFNKAFLAFFNANIASLFAGLAEVIQFKLVTSLGMTKVAAIGVANAFTMIAPFAVAAGIIFLTTQLYKVANVSAEAQKKIASLNQEISKGSQDLKSLDSLKEKYETLSTVTNKTAEQQKEWIDVQNQIASILPNTIAYHDENGNAVLKEGLAYDELTASMREYITEKKKEKSGEAQKAIEGGILGGGDIQNIELIKKTMSQMINPSTEKLEEFREKLEEQVNSLKNNTKTILEADSAFAKLSDSQKQAVMSYLDNSDVINLTSDEQKNLAKNIIANIPEILKQAEAIKDNTNAHKDNNSEKYKSIKINKDYTEAIKNADKAYNDSVNTLQILGKAINELNENGKLQGETLQKISDEYPQLTSSIYEYNAGLINESELLSRIKDEYAKQEDVVRDNFATKIALNNELYTKSLQTNQNLVNGLRGLYGNDLGNFQNYSQAKLSTDVKVLQIMGKNWSEFFSKNAQMLASFQRAALKTASTTASLNDNVDALFNPQATFEKTLNGMGAKVAPMYVGELTEAEKSAKAINAQRESARIAAQQVINELNSEIGKFSGNLDLSFDTGLGNVGGGSGGGGSKKDLPTQKAMPEAPIYDTFTPEQFNKQFSYADYYDSRTEDLENGAEKFIDAIEYTNQRIELAQASGNKEEVLQLQSQLIEQKQAYLNSIHERAESLRELRDNEVIKKLYSFLPELEGQLANDDAEISSELLEKKKEELELKIHELDRAKVDAKNAVEQQKVDIANQIKDLQYAKEVAATNLENDTALANYSDDKEREQALKQAKEDSDAYYDNQIRNLEATKNGLNDNTESIDSQIESIQEQIKQLDSASGSFEKIQEGIAGAKDEHMELNAEIKKLNEEIALGKIEDFLNDINNAVENVKDSLTFKIDTSADGDYAEKISYLSQLRTENIKLINAENEAIKMLQESYYSGKISVVTYTEELDKHKDTLLSLEKEQVDYAEQMAQINKELFDTRVNSVQKAEEEVVKMLEKSADKEKELLDEKLDMYKEYIQEKIDILDRENDETDYNKQLQEEQEQLAEIQQQLSTALLDDSVANQSTILDLKEKERDQIESIEELQTNRSRTLRKQNLTDALKKEEEFVDDKKKKIDEDFSNEKNASNARIALLEGEVTLANGKVIELKDAMVNFYEETGKGVTDITSKIASFTQQLSQAVDALKEFQSVGADMDNLDDINSENPLGTMSNKDYNSYVDNKKQWTLLNEKLSDKSLNELEKANIQSMMSNLSSTNQSLRSKYNIDSDKFTYNDLNKYKSNDVERPAIFSSMSDSDFKKYVNNKGDWTKGNRQEEASKENAELRAKYGISYDTYTYEQLKKYVKGSYKDGGIIDFTGLASVHGSKSKPEMVLNNSQLGNLFNLLNTKLSIPSFTPPAIAGSSGVQLHIDKLVNIEGDVTDKTKLPTLNTIGDYVMTRIKKEFNKSGM